ncbi:hypothetical protein MC885_012497 [Smutsia gigantea]|nr:hypothetical protein MC885_012497 [Smutsia gigantea]
MTESTDRSPGHILCCECGIPISPNPANICVACLQSKVDISQVIPKQVSISFPKQCQRYFQPPGTWIQCALESRKLLALCLKKIKAPLSKTLQNKTFYYLDQLILKYGMYQNTLRIKEIHDGLDFYYSSKQHAQKMIQGLTEVSQDIHNNTYNYKSTFSVEIVPVCKDNGVCLSPKLAQSLGNMNQICVCIRVTSASHLIDPNTLQVADIDRSIFWSHPFNSLCHPKQLEEFILMDCSIVRDLKCSAGTGITSKKHTLGEVWVRKTSETNTNKQYFCRTHLGHLLNPGDLVLEFDLANCNLNDEHVNKMNSESQMWY